MKLTIPVFVLLSLFNMVPVSALDPIDLEITPYGYTAEYSVYSYGDYVSMLASNGVVPSDFMKLHDPIEMAVMAYFKGNILVYIEVFKFGSVEEAGEEYEAQRNDRDGGSKLYNGPMFQRFISRDRIFKHQNYITLVSFDPYNDMDAYDATKTIFEEFIANMIQVVETDIPSPPRPNGDEAVWGIEVGDEIQWEIDDDTFAGTITSGGSSSSVNWTPEIEVMDISPSGHAVLIREQRAVTEYWWEDEARSTINVPYEGYSWRTIHNNGLTITDSKDKQTMPLIYPLVLNGVPMGELLNEAIENLPEKTHDDGNEYYRVYGKTRSGSGYTPVETQWLDIVTHQGTGIVTSYDWYYNNNDYGITARSQIQLGDTNFNLASRTPPADVLKTFNGDIYVDPNPGTVGSRVKVQLDLFDEEGASVPDASVTILFEGIEYSMNEDGYGSYLITLDTDDLGAGEYEGILIVEKSGFESTEGGFTFTLKGGTPTGSISTQDPNQTEDSIPGMPMGSLLIGALLVIYIFGKRDQIDTLT